MEVLYDSVNYSVVHVQLIPAEPFVTLDHKLDFAFEIIDKYTCKGVFLHKEWAQIFDNTIKGWQANTPTQELVEEILGSYAALAQIPITYQ